LKNILGYGIVRKELVNNNFKPRILVMTLKFLEIFTMLCVVAPFFIVGYLKKWCEKKEAHSMMLEMRWRHTRTVREEWKKKWKRDHPYSTFDFDDPHYQWLFNSEISAEVIYLLSIDGKGAEISWRDWDYERELAMDNE
jgi:hypothetical protein